VIELGPRLISREDQDVSQAVAGFVKEEGIDVARRQQDCIRASDVFHCHGEISGLARLTDFRFAATISKSFHDVCVNAPRPLQSPIAQIPEMLVRNWSSTRIYPRASVAITAVFLLEAPRIVPGLFFWNAAGRPTPMIGETSVPVDTCGFKGAVVQGGGHVREGSRLYKTSCFM
jgi:hypothetical protein